MIPKLKYLLIVSFAFCYLAVFADLDLPPPPGYAEPTKPKPNLRPDTRPRVDESTATDAVVEVIDGSIVIIDPIGDISRSLPLDFLDIEKVTFTFLSEKELAVAIQFHEWMPETADEGSYCDVFLSLDIDSNKQTGTLYDGLGIDLSMKFKGFDRNTAWTWKETSHSSANDPYQIRVASAGYEERTLTIILNLNGPNELTTFGVQFGALANYKKVDGLPNRGPLYLDLNVLKPQK